MKESIISITTWASDRSPSHYTRGDATARPRISFYTSVIPDNISLKEFWSASVAGSSVPSHRPRRAKASTNRSCCAPLVRASCRRLDRGVNHTCTESGSPIRLGSRNRLHTTRTHRSPLFCYDLPGLFSPPRAKRAFKVKSCIMLAVC